MAVVDLTERERQAIAPHFPSKPRGLPMQMTVVF